MVNVIYTAHCHYNSINKQTSCLLSRNIKKDSNPTEPSKNSLFYFEQNFRLLIFQFTLFRLLFKFFPRYFENLFFFILLLFNHIENTFGLFENFFDFFDLFLISLELVFDFVYFIQLKIFIDFVFSTTFIIL